MSRSSSASAEFWMLINNSLNETISTSDLCRLEALLDGDDELQKLYRDVYQLHINLDAEMRSQGAIDRIFNSQGSLCVGRPSGASPIVHPIDDNSSITHRLQVTRAGWLGVVACAATLTFFAFFASFKLNTKRHEHTSIDNSAKGRDIVSVQLSSADSRYLSIGNVGSIQVQGPAHLELFGTSRARLYRGRIKVRITDPRGRGFVVETPQGNVIDLGTEFGIDVADGKNTGVVVFEGAVDLEFSSDGHKSVHAERLLQGEGLSFSEAGETDRIMSIFTGKVATFQQRGEARLNGPRPTIVDVSDNIRTPDLRKFYEIVPGGLREDALAYVDRPAHDWSGVGKGGIPKYLIGADYIKPFNSDKMRSDVRISVKLSRPARLFVFADDRVAPPNWLLESFRDTGDDIGHDVGAYVLDGKEYFALRRGFGPGKSIDSTFSIWEQVVQQPATIELGPNFGSTELTAMYGIAAIPLEPQSEHASGVKRDSSAKSLTAGGDNQ